MQRSHFSQPILTLIWSGSGKNYFILIMSSDGVPGTFLPSGLAIFCECVYIPLSVYLSIVCQDDTLTIGGANHLMHPLRPTLPVPAMSRGHIHPGVCINHCYMLSSNVGSQPKWRTQVCNQDSRQHAVLLIDFCGFRLIYFRCDLHCIM